MLLQCQSCSSDTGLVYSERQVELSVDGCGSGLALRALIGQLRLWVAGGRKSHVYSIMGENAYSFFSSALKVGRQIGLALEALVHYWSEFNPLIP